MNEICYQQGMNDAQADIGDGSAFDVGYMEVKCPEAIMKNEDRLARMSYITGYTDWVITMRAIEKGEL